MTTDCWVYHAATAKDLCVVSQSYYAGGEYRVLNGVKVVVASYIQSVVILMIKMM